MVAAKEQEPQAETDTALLPEPKMVEQLPEAEPMAAPVVIETKPEKVVKVAAKTDTTDKPAKSKPAETAVAKAEAEPAKAEPAEKPAAEAEPVAEPEAVVGNRVQITLSGSSWIQVSDASGKNLVANVRGTDTPVDLTGEAPFRVVVGAPEHLELLSFDGESVAFGTVTPGKPLRLRLPH